MLKTKGIVLHHIKYGDTSIICKILTETLGIQSFIVNGVRTSKSKWKTNLFQHLQPLDLVIYYKEGRNLHRIREASPLMIFTEIPFNIRKSIFALFISEVLYRSLPGDVEAEDAYQLAFRTVSNLESRTYTPDVLFYFLMGLSECLGFHPELGVGANPSFFDLRDGIFSKKEPVHSDFLDREETAFVIQILQHGSTDEAISSSPETKYSVLTKLILYYRIHQKDFGGIRSLSLINAGFFE